MIQKYTIYSHGKERLHYDESRAGDWCLYRDVEGLEKENEILKKVIQRLAAEDEFFIDCTVEEIIKKVMEFIDKEK